MLKTVLVMEARKQDSGEIVTIPINSGIFFALLPKDTHEIRLGASWEGTFTVAEMIRLTLLPPVGELNNVCLYCTLCVHTNNRRHMHIRHAYTRTHPWTYNTLCKTHFHYTHIP